MNEKDLREDILKFLRENKDMDYTMTEINDKFNSTLATISKWCHILKAENKVTFREVGRAILVQYKEPEVVQNG